MDLKWLAAQIALGKTDVEIAKECGEPVYTVAYNRRRHLGLVRQPEGRRKWAIDRETLAALVADGKSDREIAQLHGMTLSGVKQYRQRYEIFRPDKNGQSYWAGRRGDQAANWKGGRTYSGRKGPDHPRWKGGRWPTASGYMRIWMPDHPGASKLGYVYEHRLVMEQKIGRSLRPGEVVDHIDCNRMNNHPDNLRLQPSRSAHIKDHFGGRDQLAEKDRRIAELEAKLKAYETQE